MILIIILGFSKPSYSEMKFQSRGSSSFYTQINLNKKENMYRLPLLFLILLSLLIVLQMGCVSHTKRVTVPVDTPDTFSEAGNSHIPDRWWTIFDNDQLNSMVDTALHSNFNLLTAWQRLHEARSVVDRESSALFPDLEGSAEAGVRRTLYEFQKTGNLQLGLSSVYELDLWGRIHSRIEAERYRAKATYADYQTAALSLSSEIVNVWYQLAESLNQLDLVNQQISTNEQVLNLMENRLGTGLVQSVDILRQRQLVESTREQQSYTEARIQVLKHQLAVLQGRTPQKGISAIPDSLPVLAPLPDAGVPIDLIRRRPDVQIAFNQLKATDRDLASAISNQYPRLTLSASASSAADNAGDLFKDWAFSFTGNLITPIIYGGRLRAEVDRNEAVKQQQLYTYGQTILNAFQEVEDALVREKKQRESIRSIKQQVKLARQAYQQLRIEYFNGTGNYLDVLTALDEVQQLQRDLLSANLNLVEYRIALYRSLSGSFETERELHETNLNAYKPIESD